MRIASHIVIFIFLLLASFVIEGNFQKRGSSEIVFFSQQRLSQEINNNRSLSQSPKILKALFDNKVVAITDYLSKNILQESILPISSGIATMFPSIATESPGSFILFLPYFYSLVYLHLVNIKKLITFC